MGLPHPLPLNRLASTPLFTTGGSCPSYWWVGVHRRESGANQKKITASAPCCSVHYMLSEM